jgi:general L-amino acid transport system permease protein
MRESIVFGGAVLNNRGLFLPQPNFGPGTGLVALAFVIGIASALGLRLAAKRRLERTGQTIPVFGSSLALVIGLPVIAFLLAGAEVRLIHPELGRFNVRGGVEILPEFGALLFGLVVYTAAFIAEVVRAGLLSVSRGQTEAAAALGLRRRQILNLIVIPQAKRVIIPPLTNQYLNLTKNSSLAVAIGYPDFVQIFTGTVLNQTGQAVEVVVITLAVYLALSLTTSAAMNWYNARVAYVGR